LTNYSNDTGARNAVKVEWKNGKTGEYKIGASGKVDVKYIEPGVGFSFYRDHLYVPGKQHETNNLTLSSNSRKYRLSVILGSHQFQQHFSNVMAVILIGGGN